MSFAHLILLNLCFCLSCVLHRSIIELARLRGYTVTEEPVSIQEAMQADEIFTTGTAVVRFVCFVCVFSPFCQCVDV